jgi:hypothetical protein
VIIGSFALSDNPERQADPRNKAEL